MARAKSAKILVRQFYMHSRPDMTVDVYRGRKTPIQQQQQHYMQSLSETQIKRRTL